MKDNNNKIDACIFDLDGVIVDTAKYHFIAWQELAHRLGIEFTETENEALKGVGRMESLEYILNLGKVELSDNLKTTLAAKKNENYINLIKDLDQSEVLPGVINFLNDLRKNEVKIALGSSSKNASTILSKLQIMDYFEVIIDGTKTTKTKPDPQVFEMGAEQLGVDPKRTVVFEDAIKGIEAAKTGCFKVIGVGQEEGLSIADHVITGFEKFSYKKLIDIYK